MEGFDGHLAQTVGHHAPREKQVIPAGGDGFGKGKIKPIAGIQTPPVTLASGSGQRTAELLQPQESGRSPLACVGGFHDPVVFDNGVDVVAQAAAAAADKGGERFSCHGGELFEGDAETRRSHLAT
jgi:hypothetical protein